MSPASSVHNYLHITSITLLFYDHILTLPAEIDHIWKRLRAPGSWWFLINRYFAFFGTILVRNNLLALLASCSLSTRRQITFFNFEDLSPEGCVRYSAARQALIVITAFIVSCSSTLLCSVHTQS
jgi:hypothetical protein